MTPPAVAPGARLRRFAHAAALRFSLALALGVLALGAPSATVAFAHDGARVHARSAHRKKRACRRASHCARRPRSTARRAPASAPRGPNGLRPSGGSVSGPPSPATAAPAGGASLDEPLGSEPPTAGSPDEAAPAGGPSEEPATSEPGEEPATPSPPGEEPAGGSPEEASSQTQQPGQASNRQTSALRLFSAQSFFNEPLPASTPRSSESAQLVASFVHQVQAHYGHAVINTTEWSAPVYTVAANAPTSAVAPQNVACPRGEDVFAPFAQAMSAVPIPAGAQAAKGTDEDMVVWQPSTGREWELWRAQREDGQWTACWGGEFQDARTSDGVFPAPLGVSASGLSILAGQIHLEELQQGQIEHALEVSLPDTAPGFVWPANRDDGESHAADAIHEGTRFRLNPSLDLASLHLNPVALAVATAIQRYGLIVSDTAGAVALAAQDPSPLMREGKANPYVALLGSNPYGVLEAVPWGQLEAVSPGYER
jgi:hypothetical protein